MKKITAFFMAFLPFFVIILLFISGMIVKNNTHVWVSAVEIVETNEQVLKDSAEAKPQIQLHANVLPLNATHPEVTWTPSNPDIIEVNNEGLVTCKDWGEAYVYATSKENQTLSAACKIDVYDTKVHVVNVSNKYDASYIGVDSRTQLKVETKPSLTHITDATMTYTALDESEQPSTEVIDVTNEGLIIPKKEGKAKVRVITGKELNEQKWDTVDVTVGKGIDAISFNNTGKEIISDTHVDLFKDLEVSPDKKDVVSATDFTYTCDKSSADVALKEDGTAEFLTACTANFTATYKRNPALKTSKTIECTNNQLKHVYFSHSNLNVVWDPTASEQIIPSALDEEHPDNPWLTWYTYPYVPGTEYSSVDGVEITSSDDRVVQVIEGNNKKILKVVGSGDAVLTATVKISETAFTTDSCLIHVALPDSGFVKKEVTTDSCYFPLRNAINLPADKQSNEDISYQVLNHETLVSVDSNNILHFKGPFSEPLTVEIMVKKNKGLEQVTENFKVTCNATQTVEKEVSERIVIPVGQATKLLNGYKGIFSGEAYESKFDVSADGETFIAKCGQNIEQFKITNDSTTKTIQLIVTEDPLYIQADQQPLYITPGTSASLFSSDTTVDVANEVNAKIIPETATYPDGSKYSFNYDYEWQGGQAAGSIENDVATFTKAGILNAKVEVDVPENNKTISQTYSIYCTHGNSNLKFGITNGTDPVQQYQEFKLTPGSTQILKCDIPYAQYDFVNAESTTGLCSVVKNYSVLEGTTFTITAPATKSGLDVIKISTETYSVFVRINVSATATDIVLTRSGVELESSNTTYTKKLKFKVLALPATVKEADITYKFNNDTTGAIQSGKYIDLSTATNWNEDNENTLEVTCGNITKKYILQHKKTIPFVTIVDSTDNKLYLNSFSQNKVSELTVNGFVDDKYFATNYEATIVEQTNAPKVNISYNFLEISGIPIPDTEEVKTYTLSLKNKETGETQTFTIDRDIIAKVEFPGHDNSDMTDKKGLQKVHVYGNHSFYKEDMKEVDYYKLPVNVYYRGKDGKLVLVENTPEDPKAVYNALKTLKPSFNKGSSSTSTINEKGFIEIRFAQNDLYSWQDITDDKFDSKSNRNVTFTLSSRSGDAKASYTFVATNGINQYCQEGLRASHDKKLSTKNNILQTNFGLPEGSKDNAPITDGHLALFGNVIGNGYTINFSTRYMFNCEDVHVCWALNTTFQACDDNILTWERRTMGLISDQDVGPDRKFLWEYLVIKNFPTGIYFGDGGITSDRIVKKCLITGSLERSVLANRDYEKIYFEDCIFFNSGCFTFYTFLGAQLFFKGFIDIYNFHGSEMLQHLQGYDLRSLWPTLVGLAKPENGVHTDAAGKDCINSFMVTFNSAGVHFWNSQTGQYEQLLHGLPGSAEHVAKLVDMQVKFAGLEFGIWGTRTSNVDPTGPKYSDEYNPDGSISIEFLNNQINKLKRQINYF